MKRTSCEYIVWNGLPVLRKEIAKSMINDFGFSKKEIAEKMGIAAPAVSQYLSGKRGNIDITDAEVLQQIKISAEKIMVNGDKAVVKEICRLCKLFTSKKYF